MINENLGKIAITPKGQYMAGSYERLDLVTDNGSSYLSLKDNNVSDLTVKADWIVVAEKGKAFEYSDFTPEQIALLQKPASDIAITVSNAEQLRVTAETNRNNAEGLRLSAETTRGENEANRIEAEGIRAGAETGRQTAEALRVTAEQARQTNTATAIQNAETAATNAVNAASLANEKAGLANNAAILANEKATLANDAATNANTKAGLADTAATNANAIANSKPTIFEGYANLLAGIETTVLGTSFMPVLNIRPVSIQVYSNGELKDVAAKYVSNGDNYDIKLTSASDLFGAEITVFGSLSNMAEITTIGKNKFDKTAIANITELMPNGVAQYHPNSQTSAFIEIDDLVGYVCISGLTPYTGVDGYICFYDINKTFISYKTQAANLTNISIAVPKTARFFRFSVYRRKTGTEVINIDTIQAEWWRITAYEAYTTMTTNVRVDGNGQRIFLSTPNKNKFSPNKYLIGYENFIDGIIQVEAKSSTTYYTPIPTDARFVYISGLTIYETAVDRIMAFYDANKTFISYKFSNHNNTGDYFAIPLNAAYFTFSPARRKASGETINYDTIQIEFYGETEFEAYNETLQNRLLLPFPDIKTWGKKGIWFGDSIQETATWSADGVTYIEGVRINSPAYVAGLLKLGAFRNYGYSGAKYTDTGQTALAKIHTQVATAIANNATADIIVLNAGTNDGTTITGNYGTAMGKATPADLDKSLFYEALRWNMWSLRNAYPTAICFIANPISRNGISDSLWANMTTAIQQMAAVYGFVFVNQLTESGITQSNLGTYLSDGLHPNKAGILLLASFWKTKILEQY